MVAVSNISIIKDHKSAVAIVVPRSVSQQVQDVRIFNDKGFVRWPPHINLLYPFIADTADNFAKAAEVLAGTLRSIAPFQVSLWHCMEGVDSVPSCQLC